MRKIISILSSLSLIGSVAFADQRAPGPQDYQIDVGAGKYVFVMIAPQGSGAVPDEEIRKKHPRSGLYSAKTSKLLWAINWYAPQVYVDSSGRYLVREGDWPTLMGEVMPKNGPSAKALQQLATAFHVKGKFVKRYWVRELVKDPKKLTTTVGHYFWKQEIKFKDELKQLEVLTADDQKYIFDIRTGNILSHESL